MNDERLALEAFLIDNPDLERLEFLLDEFNIFESLGAVHVEIRHSEFLAFLMRPDQSHGLGDIFVKRFLQIAVAGVDPEDLPFTAIDLDIWDLDDLEVRREWRSIDILLLSEIHNLAVIIENKVGSREHSGQLKRYYRTVEEQFPAWRILALFLTPEGDGSSDERYLPVSYETVCSLIESISASRKSSLGPDIYTLMQHYTTMLRRYILSGSEIQELCQKIYRKHQRALDLLFEYRPDLQAELHETVVELVKSNPDFTFDFTSKGYIRFVANVLDTPLLQQGKGWTETGRILLFEIKNLENRMGVYLLIGPGPAEIRERLFAFAQKRVSPFRPSQNKLGTKHQTIYTSNFLSSGDYDRFDVEELQGKIKVAWERFINQDYPRIIEGLQGETWLWEDPES